MLYITQYGIEIGDGLISSITLDPAHSFASCEWDGKADETLKRLPKKLRPIGSGYIAVKHCYDDPKLADGNNYIWLPFVNQESEMAFTGETVVVGDVMYGKIYW